MKSGRTTSNLRLKILLPTVTLLLAAGAFFGMKSMRPEVEKEEPLPNYPKIDVVTVREESLRIQIDAQGTVQPRQQTRLTARVSGHIEWVSPDFYEGGRFSKGDVLLKLDPLPYESALAEARSRLALAESVYLQELEASRQARLDWESVGNGEPGKLVLRIPQLNKAEADLEAARIGQRMASENLSYTEIKAPYNGRVQSKLVDVGQAITAQATMLGDVFSLEAMEIPLALSADDLELVRGNDTKNKPEVILQAEIGGRVHTWSAYLDRTAAMVDARTRMISAYARIEPPYSSDLGSDLTPGMFVAAKIQGRQLENAFRVPRNAIQSGSVVYRLIDGNRLESAILTVVRADAQWAIATKGINSGDRLCLTPLLFFTEGMEVTIAASPRPDVEPSIDTES